MTLKFRDGVSTADTEYGIALLDEVSGEYWTLNPSGASVVRTLLDGGTPAEAAQVLTEEYAVDIETAGLILIAGQQPHVVAAELLADDRGLGRHHARGAIHQLVEHCLL